MDANEKFMSKYDPNHPLARLAYEKAKAYGDPHPESFARQIYAESGFNANARGPQTKYGTAVGIAQFMPNTAKRFGVDPTNVESSLEGALKYRAALRKLYESKGMNPTQELVLAGYNAGEGNVLKYGGVPPFKETMDYIQRILGTYRQPPQSAYVPPMISSVQPQQLGPVWPTAPEQTQPYVAPKAYKTPGPAALPTSYKQFADNFRSSVLGRLYGGSN